MAASGTTLSGWPPTGTLCTGMSPTDFMTPLVLLSRLLLLFTLACASLSPLSALAQLGNSDTSVVTTDQVRAELVAQAPDGIGPGKVSGSGCN